MIKTIKHLIYLAGVSILLVCFFYRPSIHAQSTATTVDQTPGITYYEYVAKKGDSLTRMVRHSLQLLSEERNLSLQPAALVYCETTVSQSLGNIRLEPGQNLKIPQSNLLTCAEQSKLLTAKQLAAWQKYAANVSFDTSDLIPITVPGAVSSASTESGESDSAQTPAEETQQAQDPITADEQVQEQKSNLGYWLLGAVGALATLAYIFGIAGYGFRR